MQAFLFLVATNFCVAAAVAFYQRATPQTSIQESDEEVKIHGPDTDSTRAAIPIVAMSFTGDSGPKLCRGSMMSALKIPRPVSQIMNNTCYDLYTMARCGVFIGEEADTCEARLYVQLGCPENPKGLYTNTVAFIPEYKAVGGNYRSMLVRCGMNIKVPHADFLEEAKGTIS